MYSDALYTLSPGFVAWLSLKSVCSLTGNKKTEIGKSVKFFQFLLKDDDWIYLICIDIIPKIT